MSWRTYGASLPPPLLNGDTVQRAFELQQKAEAQRRDGLAFGAEVFTETAKQTAADVFAGLKATWKFADATAGGIADSAVDSWFALEQAYDLAKNPGVLVDKLNSDADSAIFYLSAGVDVSAGLAMAMADMGAGISVRQLGDDTPDNPAVYELTLEGNDYVGGRLGVTRLPKAIRNLAYLQMDGTLGETLTFRFSSKAEVASAIQALGLLKISEQVDRLGKLMPGARGTEEWDRAAALLATVVGMGESVMGSNSGLSISGMTSEAQDLMIRATGDRVLPESPLLLGHIDFLRDHLHAAGDRLTVRGMGAADTTRIKKLFGAFGLEFRGMAELALSRNVIPPQGEPGDADYKPGQVSYSLNTVVDATSRSKASLSIPKSGSKDGYSAYGIDYARHNDGGRSVTLSWELKPEAFDGDVLHDDPFVANLFLDEAHQVRPKWATIVSTSRDSIEDAQSVLSGKRPDRELETLRITLVNPAERPELLQTLATTPDLDKSIAALKDTGITGVDALRSVAKVASDGIESLPGAGLPVGVGGYLYINIGLNDVVELAHHIVMGEGFPGADKNPPRIPDATPGRRLSPRLLQNGYDFVEVQEGDTLSKIAKRENIDLEALVSLNREHIPDPDELHPGDLVFIPKATFASSDGDAAARDDPSGQTV